MERSRHRHRVIAALSPFALMAALTACGPAASDGTGQLVGVVYTRGGVIEARPAEATLTAAPVGGDPSRAMTTETASDGSFSVDLPTGTYELTGTLTTRNRGDRVTPQEVTITAGHTTSADLFVNYP